MSRKINTESFLQWLRHQVQTAKHYECEAQRKGKYIDAYTIETERKTYEFMILTITSENDTDIGEFMEEEDEQ